MQKPTGGARRQADVQRSDRARASATFRLNRLTGHAMRGVQQRVAAGASVSSATLAAAVRPFASAERALPIAVAAIVAVAALLAFLPNTPQGAVGGVQGSGTDVRYAVNGGVQLATPEQVDGSEAADAAAVTDLAGLAAIGAGGARFQPVTLPTDVTTQAGTEQVALDSAVQDDGTLLTGYAPLTTVEDGADLIQRYKVRSGDTLVTIARKFNVSMMTLWWANKLKTKSDLHVGQTLRIPPVSGLVYTVTATDTLETLAATYNVGADRIVELNGLEDPTLVVGQVLVLPGAKGAPIPTPKPTPKAKPRPASRIASSGSSSGSGPSHYSGGAFRWPVIGGNNYISQYFHYGHYAIDIAADFGSRVVAAAGGTVTFAGWKSNGGGYQVWISHGSGLYTTYNHMSGVSVGRGESVGRGQQVGHVGQSGNATGPHLHFEVWKGPVWDGGTRVNPLRYF